MSTIPKEWWYLFTEGTKVVARQFQTTIPGPLAVFPVIYQIRGSHGNYSHWCTLIETPPIRVFLRTFELQSVDVTPKGIGLAHYAYVGLRRGSPLQSEWEKTLKPERLPA